MKETPERIKRLLSQINQSDIDARIEQALAALVHGSIHCVVPADNRKRTPQKAYEEIEAMHAQMPFDLSPAQLAGIKYMKSLKR